MNKEFFNDLYSNNLIVIPKNLFKRKKQELSALEKLKGKDNYLSKYNLAVRHLFLFFLDNGYDIPNPKVHFIFRQFCREVLKMDSFETHQIIASRHNMKYKSIEPSQMVMKNLENVIGEIMICNNKKSDYLMHDGCIG